MRFFFRSRQFKIILIILAALLCIAVLGRWVGGNASPQGSILETVIAPFQKVATAISDYVIDIKTRLNDSGKLIEENEKLKSKNAELVGQIVDYEEIKDQNEFYKDFLEIKDKNPDYKFQSAKLISTDPTDPYCGFNINKGILDGIAVKDPVITSEGLIGYISEVGASYSKVTTLISTDINIGAIDIRSSDAGVVSGSVETAKEGFAKLYNLPRSASVAVGDYITTSGGGVFPTGLVIGMVEDIKYDAVSTSLYAVIKPAVDLEKIKNVMVITSFSGQGDIAD